MMNPGNSSTSPVDTHWTRILYHDLLQANSPSASQLPTALTGKEADVAARGPSDGAGAHRPRSPIASAVILLGIYVAMYLAVAGIKHALTSPDTVVTLASSISTAHPAAAAAPASPTAIGESTQCGSPPQAAEPAGNSRDCTPGVAIDSGRAFP